MLRRWLGSGALACVAVGSLAVLVDCFTDTRDEQKVTVITDCDLTKLDPSVPQQTVKVYVQTAESLAAATDDLNTKVIALCTQMAADLGLPAGNDLSTACQPIVQRATIIRRAQPPNDTPVGVDWFGIKAPPSCSVDDSVKATCLGTCGSPCTLGACDGGAFSGTCPGTCTGTCTAPSQGAVCAGSCRGSCSPFTADFCIGAGAATSECIGKCLSSTFEGSCPTGCASKFIGFCGGTCTGKCRGNPINVQDAGITDAGDAGDGEAGPPVQGPPPTNADGNCTGICEGQCSSNAGGNCNGASCDGPMSGGTCTGFCTGECISAAGVGCGLSPNAPKNAPPPVCTGLCVTDLSDGGGPCAGQCDGTCSQAFTAGACAGRLDCGQNLECDLACSAQSQIASVCNPPDKVEAYAATDPPLYPVLKKYGAQIIALSRRAGALHKAVGFISQRTAADFAAVGAKGDLVRACVARGNTSVDKADAVLKAFDNVDLTISH